MPAFQFPFHELVKLVEIDIAKQLRSEIADGQTATFGTVEQALAVRQSLPVGARANDTTALSRGDGQSYRGNGQQTLPVFSGR